MNLIHGDLDVVLTIVFRTPPGTVAEQAGRAIMGGVTIPLASVQFVKTINVNVVPADSAGPKLV